MTVDKSERNLADPDNGYPMFLVRRLQAACGCGECDTCAAAVMIQNLLDAFDNAAEADSRAALPFPEAQEWQPIETAPKDGTPILRPHIHWGTMSVRYRTAGEKLGVYEWLTADISNSYPERAFLPFWMNPPSPPSAQEQK